jgi:SHS2 domain-containing protein
MSRATLVAMPGYEILEHTADVGVRAWGDTLEECFEQATWGLAEIIGIDRPGSGERVEIELCAEDVGALLVDWLNEVLYLHETRDAAITAVDVRAATDDHVAGVVALQPRTNGSSEGTQVKAVTYHQLEVTRRVDGFVAQVYVDV